MTIEDRFYVWLASKDDVKKAKVALNNAIKESEEREQEIYNAIYEKRDSHLKHYGEYTIQSGKSVFSFNFTGKNGASSSIEDFKEVKHLSLDE